jgi:hypothetical protein
MHDPIDLSSPKITCLTNEEILRMKLIKKKMNFIKKNLLTQLLTYYMFKIKARENCLDII